MLRVAFDFRHGAVLYSGNQAAADAAVGTVRFRPLLYSIILNS
jgi:hypothetical protein